MLQRPNLLLVRSAIGAPLLQAIRHPRAAASHSISTLRLLFLTLLFAEYGESVFLFSIRVASSSRSSERAGVSSVYLPQCASQGTTQLCVSLIIPCISVLPPLIWSLDMKYNDNVINAGSSGYANAYFEIRYVRVYGTATPSTSGASPSSSQKSGVALANAMIWACLALIWFGI